MDRESNEIFLAELPNRKKLTLERVIEEHVLPGTKILTDGWAGYKDLEKRGETQFIFCFVIVCVYIQPISGYLWDWVNHDKCYVDPDTGVHTNTIESR